MAESSKTPIAAQPQKIEVVERPGSGTKSDSRAGTATGSAKKKPAEKNYLKRYFAQSFMTEEERRQRDTHPFKDCNPFTIRQFCHENICQAIPEKTPIRQGHEQQQAARVEEPKDERPTTQRIKEAFKKGRDEPNGTAVEEPENVEGPEPLDAK